MIDDLLSVSVEIFVQARLNAVMFISRIFQFFARRLFRFFIPGHRVLYRSLVGYFHSRFHFPFFPNGQARLAIPLGSSGYGIVPWATPLCAGSLVYRYDLGRISFFKAYLNFQFSITFRRHFQKITDFSGVPKCISRTD